MVKHRHHKIPTHAGGSDDASNIELLTVEEHAEAHRILYEQYGRIEDKLAWKGLAGLISKADLVLELQRLGGYKSIAQHQPWENATSTNWKINRQNQEVATACAASPDAIAKRKKTMADAQHQRGEKNAAFGTSIYRDAAGNRKRFVRDHQPEGWVLSAVWVEQQKRKTCGAYGKRWYNDSMTNFLLSPTDERVKGLRLGRLNPGF